MEFDDQVRVTSGARKHKLTRSRILFALENAELVAKVGDAGVYHGVDSLGVELEMILVPDNRRPGRMSCIHAMPIHYREK